MAAILRSEQGPWTNALHEFRLLRDRLIYDATNSMGFLTGQTPCTGAVGLVVEGI